MAEGGQGWKAEGGQGWMAEGGRWDVERVAARQRSK